jgi:Ni/Fe-hydrogenase subunit HybB-like protein
VDTGTDRVVARGHTAATVTDKISSIVLARPHTARWLLGFAIAFGLLLLLIYAVLNLLVQGIGIWGVQIPVAWGFAIVNFVWWIGIGHAGTLISAVLLLLRQDWRTSINRFAEAMTLFAVACAALFPVLHLGRPGYAYWLLPYPSTMGVWPQFRSPLVWDAFAVGTYATVSLLFWYMGLVPDLATLRDRATRPVPRLVYGVLAMGWRGAARHWYRYRVAYVLLAGLATPLVLSVHTIVSFDFAVAILPGWHDTFFPAYFVAGAVYSGFAMVLALAIPLRALYGLHDFIRERHLDVMGRVMLAMGLVVAYGYLMEAFTALYSGEQAEVASLLNRMQGPYAPVYWALLATNVALPQILWVRRVRVSPLLLFLVSLSICVGMWLERFVIVVVNLSRDFVPSSWGEYAPTVWDVATLAGSLGLFFTLLLLFIRWLPMISIAEMRELVATPAAETTA